MPGGSPDVDARFLSHQLAGHEQRLPAIVERQIDVEDKVITGAMQR